MGPGALLFLAACADPRPGASALDHGRLRASPPPPAAPTVGDFTYIGPGSMGRFVDWRLHPTLRDVLIGTADIGGVYLSRDDGASWDNVTNNLPTNGVWAVDYVTWDDGAGTRVVLGTDSGVFYSDDLDTSDDLDPEALRWNEVSGPTLGDERPDEPTLDLLRAFNRTRLSMPVSVITVDPSDPDLVWAGITGVGQVNLAQNPKDPFSVQRFDRWKVYRSADGGRSFEPALRFSAPIADFETPPYDSDGQVFSIAVDPEDSGRVWVASDSGLYLSQDGDTTEDADGDGAPDIVWAEVGTAARRESRDLGVSWTDTDAGCEDWASGTTATSWCLPIQTNARVEYVLDPDTGWPLPGYESHPNTRGLSVSNVGGAERLYITVWDRGHADDEPEDCSRATAGDKFTDSTLSWYRGGVYASDDGGESWRWLLTDTGAPGLDPDTTPLFTVASYRCDEDTSERTSSNTVTFFSDVDATPEADADLLIVATLGLYSGLWSYDASAASPWTFLTNQKDRDFKSRFEGSRPYNISLGNKTEASRLYVNWADATDSHPDVYFSTRGILKASWNSSTGVYNFDHLGSDYQGVSGDGLPMWSGTGLDDAVVWDVAEVGDELYVGVSDGSLMRATWDGDELDYVSLGQESWTPNWSDDPDDLQTDETQCVVYDAERDIVYAPTVVSATETLYSMFALQDGAWSIIGGYGYVSDEAESEEIGGAAFNNLYTGSPLARMDFVDLLVVPESVGAIDGIALVAATSDGLWDYSPDRAAGEQWQPLCDDRGDGLSFAQINADFDLAPGVAFAVDEDLRAGGLLAVDLLAGTCTPIHVRIPEYGHDPIKYPSSVALAEDSDGAVRLVVGARFNSSPGLFSGALDCASGTCTVDAWTWSFSGEGLYADDDPQGDALSRMSVNAIAVDPLDKTRLWAGLDLVPGADYYNPQYMLTSADGGQTVELLDFEADPHGLPNRATHMMAFSEDGSTLYVGGRSSLFRMPVSH